MELVIWKNDNTLYTKVFQTYIKGDKKEAIVIKSKNTLVQAIRLAIVIIKNHTWLASSALSDKHVDSNKPVKRYYNKSNKKK